MQSENQKVELRSWRLVITTQELDGGIPIPNGRSYWRSKRPKMDGRYRRTVGDFYGNGKVVGSAFVVVVDEKLIGRPT